jgi:hypothetical protein
MLMPYGAGERPAFADSYDMTGRGLDSPGNTRNMCWTANVYSQTALGVVLGIGPDVVLADLAARLGHDAVYGTCES